ncbi:hypothetical protein LR48_Vigan06g065900 [Vigna angularis]|uniref:Uncharacterized protein n=1 Tax=Phaseolus angularis TaxID=3914 RepID=A0A0L9URG6_PHAAN|nr:hypothetical protein LR48_Vigan06g065900 [Vigna angularis]
MNVRFIRSLLYLVLSVLFYSGTGDLFVSFQVFVLVLKEDLTFELYLLNVRSWLAFDPSVGSPIVERSSHTVRSSWNVHHLTVRPLLFMTARPLLMSVRPHPRVTVRPLSRAVDRSQPLLTFGFSLFTDVRLFGPADWRSFLYFANVAFGHFFVNVRS